MFPVLCNRVVFAENIVDGFLHVVDDHGDEVLVGLQRPAPTIDIGDMVLIEQLADAEHRADRGEAGLNSATNSSMA